VATATDRGAVVSAARSSTAPAPAATVRRARLKLARIDPWSMMKLAFVLSIALALVVLVAVGALWFVLDSAGVFDSITRTVTDVTGQTSTFQVADFFQFSRVMGFAILVAVVNVVLITALATLAAFLYNLSGSMVGGLEITLSEDS
jgi:hypothetical protein